MGVKLGRVGNVQMRDRGFSILHSLSVQKYLEFFFELE